MKTICYIVAMVAEAKPFIDRYGIKKVDNFFSPLPCQLYEGEVERPRWLRSRQRVHHGRHPASRPRPHHQLWHLRSLSQTWS